MIPDPTCPLSKYGDWHRSETLTFFRHGTSRRSRPRWYGNQRLRPPRWFRNRVPNPLRSLAGFPTRSCLALEWKVWQFWWEKKPWDFCGCSFFCIKPSEIPYLSDGTLGVGLNPIFTMFGVPFDRNFSTCSGCFPSKRGAFSIESSKQLRFED